MIPPPHPLLRIRDDLSSPRSWPAVAVTAATLAAVTFCSSPPPGLSPVPDPARLYYNDSGGIADSTRKVVRDVDTWQEAWSRATSRQEDPPPTPAVDFDQDMVLMATAGRSSPGDRIRIDSVGVTEQATPGGDTREVLRVVVRTVRACGDFQGEAFPVEIVRVRTFDGPVDFVERTEQGPGCQGAAAPGAVPTGARAAMQGDRRPAAGAPEAGSPAGVP